MSIGRLRSETSRKKLLDFKKMVEDFGLHGRVGRADSILTLFGYSEKTNIYDTILMGRIVRKVEGNDFSKKALWMIL